MQEIMRQLLIRLGFSEMKTPELTPDTAAILNHNTDITLDDILATYKQATRQNAFIEQKGLHSAFSSGFGVNAILEEGTNWHREENLTDDERDQLLKAGFTNNSLFVQSVFATRH